MVGSSQTVGTMEIVSQEQDGEDGEEFSKPVRLQGKQMTVPHFSINSHFFENRKHTLPFLESPKPRFSDIYTLNLDK